MTISLETVVKSSNNVISTEMDGEAVLMHVPTGTYYGLNSVGAVIWKQMTEPVVVDRICNVIAEEFDVDHEVCTGDVLNVLKEFGNAGLVEVVHTDP